MKLDFYVRNKGLKERYQGIVTGNGDGKLIFTKPFLLLVKVTVF